MYKAVIFDMFEILVSLFSSKVYRGREMTFEEVVEKIMRENKIFEGEK